MYEARQNKALVSRTISSSKQKMVRQCKIQDNRTLHQMPSIIQLNAEEDEKKRNDIKKNYGIEVSSDISGSILQEIENALNALPKKIFENNLLKGSMSNGFAKKTVFLGASYYDDAKKSITINNPLGFSLFDNWYASLSKNSAFNRFFMDLGALLGLSELRGSTEELQLLMQEDSEVKKIEESLQVLSSNRKDHNRHIMAGVSDANSQEKLLSWTLRHELGHAVDNAIGWETEKKYEDDIFGSWKKYGNRNQAFGAYKDFGGTLALNEFITNCMDYPFTYDDGGVVKAGGHIFMMDEYGKWCSYNASARENAVSNYQFSATEEWFAEAFAAYYNPQKDAESRKRLSQNVRNYFYQNIGSTSATVADIPIGHINDKFAKIAYINQEIEGNRQYETDWAPWAD